MAARASDPPAATAGTGGIVAASPARTAALADLVAHPRRASVAMAATAGHAAPLRSGAVPRHVAPPSATPRAATAAVAIPVARRAPVGALRTQRRARVPWALLPRPRLAAAWRAVQAADPGAGEPRLVGVYGPLPLDAVEAAGLDGDGRLAVTLARLRRPSATGDIALARVGRDDRLVRCDLPYPAEGRDRRPSR